MGAEITTDANTWVLQFQQFFFVCIKFFRAGKKKKKNIIHCGPQSSTSHICLYITCVKKKKKKQKLKKKKQKKPSDCWCQAAVSVAVNYWLWLKESKTNGSCCGGKC